MARGQRRGVLKGNSAEFYRERAKKYANTPRKSIHAESTKNSIDRMKRQWEKFCSFLETTSSLEACTSKDFESFLHWLLDNSQVHARSTLETYWKFLSLLYTRETGHQIDKLIAKEIQESIKSTLASDFNLSVMEGPKPMLQVNDLLTILQYHWALDTNTFPHERQRVQLALILLMAAFTATRPGAIVEGA